MNTLRAFRVLFGLVTLLFCSVRAYRKFNKLRSINKQEVRHG